MTAKRDLYAAGVPRDRVATLLHRTIVLPVRMPEVDGRPAESYYEYNDGDLRYAAYY